MTERETTPGEAIPRCPRCEVGVPVRRGLNQPTLYSCGHEDLLADLADNVMHSPATELYWPTERVEVTEDTKAAQQ